MNLRFPQLLFTGAYFLCFNNRGSWFITIITFRSRYSESARYSLPLPYLYLPCSRYGTCCFAVAVSFTTFICKFGMVVQSLRWTRTDCEIKIIKSSLSYTLKTRAIMYSAHILSTLLLCVRMVVQHQKKLYLLSMRCRCTVELSSHNSGTTPKNILIILPPSKITI